MSPISQVPPDVLAIFLKEVATSVYPYPELIANAKSAFRFAAVCRQWRTTALDSPQQWASLVIPSLPTQALETVISRTKTYSWTVFLGLWSEISQIPDAELEHNYEVVLRSIDRCKGIHIRAVEPSDLYGHSAFIHAVKRQAPRLLAFTFDIECMLAVSSVEEFNLFAGASHSLGVLHLRGLATQNPALSILNSLPNLTSLVLQATSPPSTSSDNASHYFTPEARNFLRPMANLQILVLDNVLEPVTMDPLAPMMQSDGLKRVAEATSTDLDMVKHSVGSFHIDTIFGGPKAPSHLPQEISKQYV